VGDADVHHRRGEKYLDQGDNVKAKAELDRALALDPNHVEARWAHGATVELLGDYEAAVADYNKVIELDPMHATAYFRRGIVRQKTGDLERAAADFGRALELSPSFAAVYVSLGRVQEERSDWPAALAAYDKALGLFGDQSNRPVERRYPTGEIYYFRGRARAALGQTRQAIEDLEKAQSLPNNDRGREIEDLLREQRKKQ
jgi:tetratricopeptide (TPR) repeat protein